MGIFGKSREDKEYEKLVDMCRAQGMQPPPKPRKFRNYEEYFKYMVELLEEIKFEIHRPKIEQKIEQQQKEERKTIYEAYCPNCEKKTLQKDITMFNNGGLSMIKGHCMICGVDCIGKK